MRNKLAIILGGILISGLSIGAVTKVNEPVKYEYMTMIQDVSEVFVANSEKYERLKVPNGEVTAGADYRYLLKKINEYQNSGWEVIESNIFVTGQGSTPRNYVMLRKAK